jgi:hypothetical protein
MHENERLIRFSGCLQYAGGNSNWCKVCKPGFKQINPLTNDWCDYSPKNWKFSLTQKILMGFGKYEDKNYNEIDGLLNQWNLISLIDVTSPKEICIGCEIDYVEGNYFSGNTTYVKICFDIECILFFPKQRPESTRNF